MIDLGSLGGILLALAGIVGGMMMEGGRLRQIAQPTALVIVLGGTMGAVMLQFPIEIFWAAMRGMARVFVIRAGNTEAVIEQIVGFAQKARKLGIISLDADLEYIEDEFLGKVLLLAIDGTEPAELRKLMQLELEHRAEFAEQIPQVLEAAGGFAPTVGIIGAVLGLIQVMQHLNDIAAVGQGIAVAFVATIYGVGLANLICLPAAGKMKIRAHEEQVVKTVMLEGVISILEGMNPRKIEMKLRAYLPDGEARSKKRRGRKTASEEIEVPA
jgi:chemotaxis protein MotA